MIATQPNYTHAVQLLQNNHHSNASCQDAETMTLGPHCPWSKRSDSRPEGRWMLWNTALLVSDCAGRVRHCDDGNRIQWRRRRRGRKPRARHAGPMADLRSRTVLRPFHCAIVNCPGRRVSCSADRRCRRRGEPGSIAGGARKQVARFVRRGHVADRQDDRQKLR